MNIKISVAYVFVALATISCQPTPDTRVLGLETHNPKNALVLLDTAVRPMGNPVPRDIWARQKVYWNTLILKTGGKKRKGPQLYSVPPGLYQLLSWTEDSWVYRSEPTQKILFHVRAGEFVYVGQVVHTKTYPDGKSGYGNLHIKVLDRYDSALTYFRNAYPKSTRTPIKRLPILLKVSDNYFAQRKHIQYVRDLLRKNPERYGYTQAEVRSAF